MLKEKLIDRFKEPSTWRGFVMILTALGIRVSPELLEHIIATGTAVVGIIGFFTSDTKP